MEWLASTEDRSQTAASISKAFEVLRQNPSKPQTKRLGKLALRKAKGLSIYDEVDSEDEGSILAHQGITGELEIMVTQA